MKIVFMGTPDFAVSALEALLEEGYEVTAVVTQPDKPKGRSNQLQPSPVKACAQRYNIPVLQPQRIKRQEEIEKLKQYPADVYIVAAFGQILSKEILDIPRLGCLNIHASLLPKYRGASPIQQSIIDGEEITGVTIQQMNEGVDTGDILYQKKLAIDAEDTFATLHDKLAVLGGEAITELLPLLEAGRITPTKQMEAEATHVTLIEKSMGRLDFTKTAVELNRLIRGLNPWPSAFTYYQGKQLKIWRTQPVLQTDGEGLIGQENAGEIVNVTKDYFDVATQEGLLRIYEVQLEGKKRMSTHDFLLGVKLKPGEKLGKEE